MLGGVGVWLVHKPVNNCGQCRGKQDSAETDQRKAIAALGGNPRTNQPAAGVSVALYWL